MPKAYTRPEPSLLPIERPRCPKCQSRMMLARIEPSPDGSDLRTFECQKCEHVHKVLTRCSRPTLAVRQLGLNRRSRTEGIVGLGERPWTKEDNARLKEFVAQ